MFLNSENFQSAFLLMFNQVNDLVYLVCATPRLYLSFNVDALRLFMLWWIDCPCPLFSKAGEINLQKYRIYTGSNYCKPADFSLLQIILVKTHLCHFIKIPNVIYISTVFVSFHVNKVRCLALVYVMVPLTVLLPAFQGRGDSLQ